ncbi:MAG: CAP domain-containing protein [Acidobacteria bacterium]|nr:CAP domain-containing protein [Acidobacteriota bacterium]
MRPTPVRSGLRAAGGLRPGAAASRLLAALSLLVPALAGGTVSRAQADGAVDVAAQSGVQAAEVEARIAERVNAERARAGLPLLASDPKLAEVARRHAMDMAARRYFDHVSPDGKDPERRGLDAGYSCRKDHGTYITHGLGENIFQSAVFSSVTFGSGGTRTYQWIGADEIARQVVDGWMGSEGHRENLLKRSFDRQGIGVAITSGGKVYVTQDLC